MTPPDRNTSNPHAPEVVGFDMPSDAAAVESAPKVMTVLLDTTPSRLWAATLARSAAAFRAEHELDDVRLVGRNLSLIGPASRLRKLAADVKALIHRVSRATLQDRVNGADDRDPQGAESAVARPPVLDAERARDLASIAAIRGISTLLEAVARATGMRFAAVARVTDQRWTACAVYDLIDFGLLPGQDLVLESTICNEIRQHGATVSIDRVSRDATYACHPTPAMYGFESYISVPILRPDGSLFGTLCALDPEPARLDDDTRQTLEMFARMIGRELDA